MGADDEQGGQGEQPGQGSLGAGRALHLVRQSELELVVGEQVGAVGAAQGEEAAVAQQYARAAPLPGAHSAGDVLWHLPYVSGEDEDEDGGFGEAGGAEVDGEQQGPEQRADEGTGLSGRAQQSRHPSA